MRILYVEDDDLQFEVVADALMRGIPAVHVINISTESEFRSSFEVIAQSPPDLIIIDLMLPWTIARPDMPAMPQDVSEGGFKSAGLRCKALLDSDNRTQDIPVIFYSDLNLLSLEERERIAATKRKGPVFAFFKSSDFTQLVRTARSLGHAQGRLAKQTPNQHEIDIFISYSHKDKKWLRKLTDMLKPLLRTNQIKTWNDEQIKTGDLWREKVEQALAAARIGVLLVSPNFLASNFIAQNELPPLLGRARQGGLTIIWVAISASMYEETEIAQFEAANDPEKPLDSLRPPDLNKELVRICQRIKEIVDSKHR